MTNKSPCVTENLPFYSGSKSSNNESFNKELLVSDIIKMYFKGINDLNNQHINGFDKNDDDFDITPIIDCKYVDLNSFRVFEDKNKFSFLHLNIASLSLHKEELENVLTMLNFKFDVIGITETKIKKVLFQITMCLSKVINIFSHQQSPIKVA